jgi:hypothetical protein
MPKDIFFLKILNVVQSFLECKVSLADGSLRFRFCLQLELPHLLQHRRHFPAGYDASCRVRVPDQLVRRALSDCSVARDHLPLELPRSDHASRTHGQVSPPKTKNTLFMKSVHKNVYLELADFILMYHSGCDVTSDRESFMWDGLCLAFLLFQKRIFRSFYFQHVVGDMKVQHTLASL